MLRITGQGQGAYSSQQTIVIILEIDSVAAIHALRGKTEVIIVGPTDISCYLSGPSGAG